MRLSENGDDRTDLPVLTLSRLSGMLCRMGTPHTKSRIYARILLSSTAVFLTLLIVECALRIIDHPRFLDPHKETRRFSLTNQKVNNTPVYVNYPGRITFTYADNPRGYFNTNNELHHEVNPDGFRGPPFGPKPDAVQRLIFLGDSFTFGEGVRQEHVYPQVTAKYLSAPNHRVEACNLGVGGYNTTQMETTLDSVGFALQPSAVIIGYVLNDAEPPLFSIHPLNGQVIRRNREANIEAEGAPKKPPPAGIYRLHLAQLIWNVRRQSQLTKQTVNYYTSINQADNPGWIESERALRSIIAKCQDRNIPCVVVLFPILHELTDDYPFASMHEQVGTVVKNSGGIFVDLLPALKGKDAHALWVHPTDQHPNERVHAIVGPLVANALRALK